MTTHDSRTVTRCNQSSVSARRNAFLPAHGELQTNVDGIASSQAPNSKAMSKARAEDKETVGYVPADSSLGGEKNMELEPIVGEAPGHVREPHCVLNTPHSHICFS